MTTNLTDTSRCPLGVRCESCGIEAGRALAVQTIECATGVMCMTMCPRCARASAETKRRSISEATASNLVMQHAAHLGVTVEDVRMLQTANGRLPWKQPHYRWVQP